MSDATEKAIQEAEKAASEFDKDRQRADQAEANLRKAQAERDKLNSHLDEMQDRMKQQAEQMSQLTSQKQASDNISEMIPDIDVDEASLEDIAKVINSTRSIITTQAKELAELKSKASRYEQETAQQKAQRLEAERNNKILNETCNDLEEEFGAGLRNEAIKLMEQQVAENGRPANQAKAVLMLRKCFKQVSRQKTSPDTSRPPVTDTGGGGGRPSLEQPKIKKGSLEEVVEQYKKAASG